MSDAVLNFEKSLTHAFAGNPITNEEYAQLHSGIAEGMELDPSAALRRIHSISITNVKVDITDSNVVVTVWGEMGTRKDLDIGAMSVAGVHGQDFVNVIKGAITNAKSRLTASFLGYGRKGVYGDTPTVVSGATPEPAQLDAPVVNSAPAAVVEERRADRVAITVNGKPADEAKLAAAIAAEVLKNAPRATEEQVAAVHREGQKLDTPQHDPHSIVEKPVVKAEPAAPEAQVSFFDDAPLEAAAPAEVVTVTVPQAPVAEPTPAAAPASQELTVQDIQPVAPTSDKPTRLQMQKIHERCTKLSRFLLTAPGKDSPGLLSPFLKKKFGVSDLTQASLFAWEEMLLTLEAAKTPNELVQILKGK